MARIQSNIGQNQNQGLNPAQSNVGQNQGLNPAISNLFKAVRPDVTNPNLANAPDTMVRKGSLIAFNYSFWIHDPYPLVIVTDMLQGMMMRGVNLHYLSFPYIKNILKNSCENASFSYATIKADQYIVNAFRTYKWQGVRQIKKLDCDFLLTVMATVRSFDPGQVKAIKEAIQEQIRAEVNPKAVPTAEQPFGTQPQQTQQQFPFMNE